MKFITRMEQLMISHSPHYGTRNLLNFELFFLAKAVHISAEIMETTMSQSLRKNINNWKNIFWGPHKLIFLLTVGCETRNHDYFNMTIIAFMKKNLR